MQLPTSFVLWLFLFGLFAAVGFIHYLAISGHLTMLP